MRKWGVGRLSATVGTHGCYCELFLEKDNLKFQVFASYHTLGQKSQKPPVKQEASDSCLIKQYFFSPFCADGTRSAVFCYE